jgi:hypothetical protein
LIVGRWRISFSAIQLPEDTDPRVKECRFQVSGLCDMRMSEDLNTKEGNDLKLKTKTMQERLHISIAVTLIVGLSISVWIYATAEVPVENDLISDYENSKMYLRSLKVYGGQFGVLADEILRWFQSLWQGKPLAYTVASITVVVALVLYVIASDPHFKEISDDGDIK